MESTHRDALTLTAVTLRTHPQPAPVVLLRHHQQPGRGRVAGPPRGPFLGNSALDRLANASYQIVIEAAATGNGSPHTEPC